ncbi:hypothetical protein FQN57_000171 [Myotisia sp. PD_48]|nr:hypothetical protein FQN57_000171 [Myotisia sp. PD_48]
MPFGTGFQLSIELTNLVSPLAGAIVNNVGSLIFAEARRKSGSDLVTELKFASTLGRNRIEGVIEPHFRGKIARSEQRQISKIFEDLLLEIGAGPTVQHCLRDRALFSTVIQLSALSFAHQLRTLSRNLVAAFKDMLVESGGNMEDALEEIPVLATLTACQQQTAAFSWTYCFQAVEDKIKRELPESKFGLNLMNRGLDYCIFRTLLMWLRSVQEFPDHQMLHLKCFSGIITVVVWCHYILGLDTTVRIAGKDIVFGEGSGPVLIEESYPTIKGALVERQSLDESLFTLTDETENTLLAEHRVNAFGFADRHMHMSRHEFPRPDNVAHWIVGKCVEHWRQSIAKNSATIPGLIFPGHISKEQSIIAAGAFIFGLGSMDTNRFDDALDDAEKQGLGLINWVHLVGVIYAFSRVRDLKSCENLPLSVKVLSYLDHELEERNGGLVGSIPDVEKSGQILYNLLLGPTFTYYSSNDCNINYSNDASLISYGGWSVFFDVFDAVDPMDLSLDDILIMPGVPSRGGVRKTRIIDAQTSNITPGSWPHLGKSGAIVTEDFRIWDRVSSARVDSQLVTSWDADTLAVSHELYWKGRRLPIGFREKLKFRAQFATLEFCQCRVKVSDLETYRWIDGQTKYRDDTTHPDPKTNRTIPLEGILPLNRPPDGERSERVVLCSNIKPAVFDVWFFYMSSNPVARWLALAGVAEMAYLDEHSYPDHNNNKEVPKFLCILRGPNYCLKCVSKIPTSDLPVRSATLVLL